LRVGSAIYDRAIADYDEAIRLNPQFAMAYFNRGNTWQRKARAIGLRRSDLWAAHSRPTVF
jgi:tetratricopeptide (TPR) repeat protein